MFQTTNINPKNVFSRGLTVVFLGFLALAFSYSARATLGLAMPFWEAEFGWSRSFISNVGALALVVTAIAAPVTGVIQDRKGLRFTLLMGLSMLCLSCAMVTVATNQWFFMFAFGIVGGVGFGMVAMNVVATAVARTFPKKVGLASGVATSGATVGQLVVIPLVAILLTSYSWQWSFLSLAVGVACLIPFVWLVPRDSSASVNVEPEAKASDQGSNWKPILKKLIKNRVFNLLFWSYFICGFTTTGAIETHLMPFASYCGFPPLASATAYGLLATINLFGMIGIGWLTDKVNRAFLLATIYLIRALSFLLLMNIGSSYEVLIVFAIIFGIVDYSTVPITSSIVASDLGLKNMGLIMGLLTAGHQIGASIGASFGGLMFDQYGDYSGLWISSLVFAALAAIFALALNLKSSTSHTVE